MREKRSKQQGKAKPPIGIIPKWMHDEIRRDSIKDAIARYLDAGLKIPEEWVSEYNSYIK